MLKIKSSLKNKGDLSNLRAPIGLVLLFGYWLQSVPGLALNLPLVSNKPMQMLLPAYEKLFQGAGPATNDGTAQGNGTAHQTGNNSKAADLSPLTLTDSAELDNNQQEQNDNGSGAVLKSSVSTTNYVPHSGEPQVFESSSIKPEQVKKGSKNSKNASGSLSEQAAAVKIGPLPLLETEGETQKKVDTIMDAEKQQLADLWEATLTRSPDIQFVVQKLQPTSNQAHLTNILARMLSTAAFGGLGAMSMMSPSIGTFAAASMGGSMVQTALGITQSRADKKAKLSQEEELMMFNMVRTTCDKLVASYRDYKKCSTGLFRASNDLQDLQSMVAEGRSGQDAAKQVEMEYILRKQQRDLDGVADDLRRHRQSLIDLSGAEAVAKLDKQLVEERSQVDQIAADPSQQVPSENNQVLSDTNETELDSARSLAEKTKTQTASTMCPQS